MSRNGSEKMSSSMSLQPSPPVGLGDPLGLDPQQLLLVVPLVQGLGLVQALVALQPDQPGARQLGHRLGQLGLAGAGRALDQHRFAEALGQVDHAGDALVGEVADPAQTLREPRRGNRSGTARRRSQIELPSSRVGRPEASPGSLPGGGRAAPVRSRAQPNCGLVVDCVGASEPRGPGSHGLGLRGLPRSWAPSGRSRRPVRLRPGSGRIRLSTLWMIFRQLRDPMAHPGATLSARVRSGIP